MVKIGNSFNTNNCGKITVLSKSSTSHDTYTVVFENTGTVKETRGFQILNGCIRDPYAPLLCGIACTGNISTKGKYKPFYSIWHDMINRCYNPNDKRYNANRNVGVCNEWLVFENFYNDISKIEGYDYDKIVSGELTLDKDIKQRKQKQKIYSVDTCMWVDRLTNSEIQDGQQKYFIAISPTGKQYIDYNIARFAREHNISKTGMRNVLYKRKESVKGWKFAFEEIV